VREAERRQQLGAESIKREGNITIDVRVGGRQNWLKIEYSGGLWCYRRWTFGCYHESGLVLGTTEFRDIYEMMKGQQTG
jgi:hypothetical protein